MSDFIFVSGASFSIDRTKQIIAKFGTGEYGIWKAKKHSRRGETTELKQIHRSQLSQLLPHPDCTYLEIRSAAVKRKLGNHFGSTAPAMLMPFTLRSRVSCSCKLVFRSPDHCYDAQWYMPAAGRDGRVELFCDPRDVTTGQRRELLSLVGISDLFSEDGPGYQFLGPHPSVTAVEYPSGEEYPYKCNLSLSDFMERLSGADERLGGHEIYSELFSVIFYAYAGYMDVEEPIAFEDVRNVFKEIADNAGIDRFDIAMKRLKQTNWESREEERMEIGVDKHAYEALGTLEAGDFSMNVGLMYNEEGYRFSIEGLEEVQEEFPCLNSLVSDLDLKL